MKRLFAYFFAIAFAGVLVFSVLAFANGGPKKYKAETTTMTTADSAKSTMAHCQEQNDSTCQQKDAKSCCRKAEKKADVGCPNADDCKQYMKSQAKK